VKFLVLTGSSVCGFVGKTDQRRWWWGRWVLGGGLGFWGF
jgi:hypothetical protein